MEIVTREILEQVAKIMGPTSASAQSLRDADNWISQGHQVAFVRDGDTILVLDDCEQHGS